MAAAPPPLPAALHSDQRLADEYRRAVVRRAHQAQAPRFARRSVIELEADMRKWTNEWNKSPKPFIWTKTGDKILGTLAAVLAGLQGLESLALLGGDASVEGPQRLNDQALAVVAGLPGLESLTLLDGTYTEADVAQLGRLPQLRRLCIEREGLTPLMFRFATAMPRSPS
jgi:hypothetical protein